MRWKISSVARLELTRLRVLSAAPSVRTFEITFHPQLRPQPGCSVHKNDDKWDQPANSDVFSLLNCFMKKAQKSVAEQIKLREMSWENLAELKHASAEGRQKLSPLLMWRDLSGERSAENIFRLLENERSIDLHFRVCVCAEARLGLLFLSLAHSRHSESIRLW